MLRTLSARRTSGQILLALPVACGLLLVPSSPAPAGGPAVDAAVGHAVGHIPAVRAAKMGVAATARLAGAIKSAPLYETSRTGDLFYNYYAQGDAGVPAEMYPSPRPVPPNVGHTYYTYQPLYPHEMMYRHSRVYWTHRPQGGWVRTKVRYGTFSPISSLHRWLEK